MPPQPLAPDPGEEINPTTDLPARLQAAGVTDEASLQAALARDPQLRADFTAFVQANREALAATINPLLQAFAAIENSEQMADFWRSVPSAAEEPFATAVETWIEQAQATDDNATVDHLTPRLAAFKAIQTTAQQEQNQPPVVRALRAFIHAPDEAAARTLFVEQRTLLQPYEAQRILDEPFTSDDLAIQQRLAERGALLRQLRGVAPAPAAPLPANISTTFTNQAMAVGGDLYQAMTNGTNDTALDDDARRAYWAAKMDEAYAFMAQIRQYPVVECGEPVVSLVDAVRGAGVEVSFSDKPHVQGLPRLFLLRAGLIDDFIRCARAMNDRGWIMKVEDAFRTLTMQKFLARASYTFDVVVERLLWEYNGALPSVELVMRRVGALVAAAPKVGTHMSGSAIDISVLHRDSGQEVDRGRPYLEMSERTPMDSPFVSAQAQANRAAITALMRQHGFVTYPWEFWHYNQGDAYDQYLNQTGQAARYGAVHVTLTDGSVQAIENTLTPLNSYEEIESEMQNAMKRRGKRMDESAAG